MSSSLGVSRADVVSRPPRAYANGGLISSGPERRLSLFEPPPESNRANAAGQSGGIVGFDGNAAQCGGPRGSLEFGRRNFAQEAVKRLVLDHADDGIVV